MGNGLSFKNIKMGKTKEKKSLHYIEDTRICQYSLFTSDLIHIYIIFVCQKSQKIYL